eukprot:2144114-Alexandrium_andersonii.AAC.1
MCIRDRVRGTRADPREAGDVATPTALRARRCASTHRASTAEWKAPPTAATPASAGAEPTRARGDGRHTPRSRSEGRAPT